MSRVERLVFDTNTLISHLLIPASIPAQAVRKGLHKGQLIASDATLSELAEVIARPKFDRYLSIEDRQQFFRLFGRVIEHVTIIRNIQACRDSQDDKFLELAVNGRATTIVTGDQDLLILNPYQSIQIVTPNKYLKGDQGS